MKFNIKELETIINALRLTLNETSITTFNPTQAMEIKHILEKFLVFNKKCYEQIEIDYEGID